MNSGGLWVTSEGQEEGGNGSCTTAQQRCEASGGNYGSFHDGTVAKVCLNTASECQASGGAHLLLGKNTEDPVCSYTEQGCERFAGGTWNTGRCTL
ncbi:MAG: hypothetical protein KTU85_05765 [Acidimicrobiia bacterium]|nr:hypothetical protein [Acidimicrobiia bacterium]